MTTYRDPQEDPETIYEAQGHPFTGAAAVAPAAKTYRYIVEYITSSERFHRITVEALDSIDAKHLAEGLEGEVIIRASARRVRGQA